MDTQTQSDEIPPPEINLPAAKPSRKNGKSQTRLNLIRKIAPIAVIVGLMIGIPVYIHSLSYQSSDDAFIDGDIVVISPRVASHVNRVYVADNQRVKAGDLLIELDPNDFQAKLDAATAALEAAKAAYRSNAIHAELTSITTAADVNEAKANVNLAQAAVATAKAGENAAKSRIDQAQAQLEYARSMRAQAMAELNTATVKHQLDETDLNRYRQMADTISKQQMDHAVAAEQQSAAGFEAAGKKADAEKAMVAQAEAALKASRDGLRQAEAQVSAAHAQLDQANARLSSALAAPKRVEQSHSQVKVSAADIDKAAAAVQQARLELSYTKIYAPCDGYATKKYVEPGTYVQTGEALMSIVRPDVWVIANFKETQLTRMRPGQPAVVSVDAYPGVEFKGHVDSIQNGTGARFSLLPPENATGNYVKVVQRVPVKIVFDDPDATEKYLLAPGMSVVPEVDIKSKAGPLPSRPPSPGRQEGADEKTGGPNSLKGSSNDAGK